MVNQVSSDRALNDIKKNNYMLDIFEKTKNIKYTNAAYEIVQCISQVYRAIEPSHFGGKIIIYKSFSDNLMLDESESERLYDYRILANNYNSIVIELKDSDDLPITWKNLDEEFTRSLLETSLDFIAYVFDSQKEFFVVNSQKIKIRNTYDCPSIFALQYHELNEALLFYRNDLVKNVSCSLLKNCWYDDNYIYLKSGPEDCMQESLRSCLRARLRGANIIVREYNLGGRKPVDIRVFWNEANRDALLELKWLGQSVKGKDELTTQYTNGRANDGMKQIKEYVDLANGDSPSVITKGYLIIIDARRKGTASAIKTEISRSDGMHFSNTELDIKEKYKFWIKNPEIEKPRRMFVEPICI